MYAEVSMCRALHGGARTLRLPKRFRFKSIRMLFGEVVQYLSLHTRINFLAIVKCVLPSVSLEPPEW